MLSALLVDPEEARYVGFVPAPLTREDMRQSTVVDRRIFLRRAEHVWVVHDEDNHTLMVVGVSRPSQVGVPELWMLMADWFSADLFHNFRQVKLLMQDLLDLYPWVKVRVDAKSPNGQRFVKLLGFTEFHRDTHGEREYIHYEVRRGDSHSSRD